MYKQATEFDHLFRILASCILKLVVIGMGAKITILPDFGCERVKWRTQDVLTHGVIDGIDQPVLVASLFLQAALQHAPSHNH